MKKDTLLRMVRQIDELVRPGHLVTIETSGSGYEVTVHEGHSEPHYSHFGGETLVEAVNRAHAGWHSESSLSSSAAKETP